MVMDNQQPESFVIPTALLQALLQHLASNPAVQLFQALQQQCKPHLPAPAEEGKK